MSFCIVIFRNSPAYLMLHCTMGCCSLTLLLLSGPSSSRLLLQSPLALLAKCIIRGVDTALLLMGSLHEKTIWRRFTLIVRDMVLRLIFCAILVSVVLWVTPLLMLLMLMLRIVLEILMSLSILGACWGCQLRVDVLREKILQLWLSLKMLICLHVNITKHSFRQPFQQMAELYRFV